MGRKKKPFIDKKRAQTFSLVPRSQKDPLHDDPEEAQYVLKQVQGASADTASSFNDDERLAEQQKYGIYFDDDYDYLQHLKEPGATVLEPVGGEREGPVRSAIAKKAVLPKELFGSEVDVQGHDKKVLPISGPQPGWDPDIVAALEAAESSSVVDDELEDDFVTMANGGEVGLPVYVTNHLEIEDDEPGGSPWWAGRGDFSHPELEPSGICRDKSDISYKCGEGGSDVSSNLEDIKKSSQKKTVTFTEYSMTSSIVPRSEALTLLDDRFEQFMVGYEDSQLGAPDEEEEEEEEELDPSTAEPPGSGRGKEGAMVRSDYDKLLLESAVDEFEKNFADNFPQSEEESDESGEDEDDGDTESDRQEVPELIPVPSGEESHSYSRLSRPDGPAGGSADVSEEEEEEGEGESDREELELVEVDVKPPEQWDCESILSTYSNLYNHPTKITEPSDSVKKQIKLSRKTGIPLGAVPGPLSKTYNLPPSRVPTTRPREETREEKRARKRAIKEERRVRRAEKKATRLAFRNEELKLERTLASRLPTAAVV